MDVKTEANATYAALDAVLAKYPDIITAIDDGKVEQKAITVVVSGNMAKAASLHATLDYVCRLDVTMPEGTPLMPDEHARTMQGLLKKADYLDRTWELMRRKARRAFNGEVVIPLAAE